MNAVSFGRMRDAERQREVRKRDAWLALASLGAHLLAFLLIPGVVVVTPPMQELILELTAPQTEESVRELPNPGGGGLNSATAPLQGPISRPDAPAFPRQPAPAASGPKQVDPLPSTLTTQRGPQATGHPDSGTANTNKPAKGGNPAKPQPSPVVKPGGSDSTDVVVPDPVIAAPGKKNDLPKPPPADKPGMQPQQNADKQSKDQGAPQGKPKQGKPDSPPGGGGTAKEAPNAVPSKPGDTAPGKPAKPDKDGGGQGGSSPNGSAVPGGGPSTGPNPGPPGGSGGPGVPLGPSEAELKILEDYGDRCRKKIKELARNPELASEQGHKGSVKFKFTVSAKGRLLDVTVVDSSGFGELDNECEEATEVAAQYFGRFPKGVSVDKWTFNMTMKFPLY